MNPLTQETFEKAEQRRDLVDAEPALDTPSLAIARLLWQHRLRLGKATLASLLIAAVITLLIPNSYESTVQLMPPDSQGSSGIAMLASLMGKSGLGGSAGSSLIGDVLGSKSSGDLFIGILHSRTVKDRIIDRFELRKVYWTRTYAGAGQKLASRTGVEEDRKTGIISITVKDQDRVRASQIAGTYIEELDRLLSQVSTSSARRERIFLEQRLAVVHDEVQQAGKDLSEFSSKNATLDLQAQGKATMESAAALQGQLIAAQSELNGLEQIYTPDNIRVRSLQARVSELQRELNKIGGKGYTGATTLDVDALYPSIRQLPVLGMQYMELYRRAKIAETVFEVLTQEYEMAKLQEAKEIPSVKVLDWPKVAEKKSWPPRTLLSLGGAFLGFLLASCWIVGNQFWSELDGDEPHKKFVRETWAETKRFLYKKRTQLFSHLYPRKGSSS
ncbi:MAG: hypothetical protein JWO91_1544 [Acidobacteriaceae bacterium]|nr:hypothetical protein [Acidobacteriaceae bacterium]